MSGLTNITFAVSRDGSAQQNFITIAAAAQDAAAANMTQPMHAPTDANEDAGLAPYLGVIATIIIVAFLGWKFFKSGKKGDSGN